MRGFQLWVNLPAGKKMTAPAYQEIQSPAIPEVTKDGATVRVIAGNFDGQRGPVNDPNTGVQVIADILERAASTDADKIIAATRKTDFKDHPVVGGPIRFDEKGDNTGALTALIQVQPDQDLFKRVKVVAPKEFAESGQIVFPWPQLWER